MAFFIRLRIETWSALRFCLAAGLFNRRIYIYFFFVADKNRFSWLFVESLSFFAFVLSQFPTSCIRLPTTISLSLFARIHASNSGYNTHQVEQEKNVLYFVSLRTMIIDHTDAPAHVCMWPRGSRAHRKKHIIRAHSNGIVFACADC